MNEQLSLLFNRLIENSQLVAKFNEQKTLDELYKFCVSVCDGYTMDEFKEFLNMLIYVNSKFDKKSEEISDASLESVAGGINFGKHKNEMLAMLIAGALVSGGGYAHSNLGAGSGDFSPTSVSKSAENTQENLQVKIEELAGNITANAENAVHTMAATAEKLLGKVLDATSPSASAMYSYDSPLPSAPSLQDTIRWPTASKITYGQKVSASRLSGGSSAAGGRFDWHPMYRNLPAPEVGTWMCRVVFTFENVSYESDIPVTVEKATPTVSSPSASNITYGQILNSSTISSSRTSVPGSFRWENSNQKLNAGTHKVRAIFEPADTVHYNPVNFTVSVEVKKANVDITSFPLATPITYGQSLFSSSLMSGQASTPGKFSWLYSFYQPNAGTHFASVNFIPFDKNYNSRTITVPVVVNKADPILSKKYVHLSYEPDLKLKDISLPSGWQWENPYKALDKIGSFNYIACHQGNSNYNSKIKMVTVELKKATPTVSSPFASNITYGQTLNSSTISSSRTSVPGSFRWDSSNQKLNAGTHKVKAIFEPADTVHYNSVDVTVSVEVKKADVDIISAPLAHDITYGQVLINSKLADGQASVPGSFCWSNPSYKPGAGTHFASVDFIPFDKNYNSRTITVPVVVNKADPILSKKYVLSYEPDLKLKDISLPSGWQWENPYKALDKIGSFNYIACHQGDSNYNSKSETVTVELKKAEPTLALGSITYDEKTTLKDIKLPVGWSWNNPGETPVVSKSSYSASFDAHKAGTAEFCHSRSDVSIQLKVNLKSPVVKKWPTDNTSLVYGSGLRSIKLSDGKASVPGVFVFESADINDSNRWEVGDHKVGIKFVPNNENYSQVRSIVDIKVVKNTTPPDAPEEIKVLKRKNHSIILEENSNLEYSIDNGKTWQESSVFNNLKSSTKYYIIARVKETKNRVAGKPSVKQEVKTRSWVGNLLFG